MVSTLSSATRRRAGRLDADDAHLGQERLDDHRDAADEPAATDGDDDDVEAAELIYQLQADGALPRDHLGILERMHQQRAAPLRVRGGDGPRVVPVAAVPLDARAHVAQPPLGRLRRALGQIDRGRHAAPGRRVGDAEPVVAARRGDHAVRELRRLGGEQPIAGAARLERAGHLQLLELEPDVALPAHHRRRAHVRRDPLLRRAHVVERNEIDLAHRCTTASITRRTLS
jgi:hypothetical protein